jgi:hypothetical protein
LITKVSEEIIGLFKRNDSHAFPQIGRQRPYIRFARLIVK